MRPVGNGRPGTEVFPADWDKTHAPIVTAMLNCTITIGLPGGPPVWDEAAGQTVTPVVNPLYTGPAGIAALSTTESRTVEAAEDQVPARGYEITLGEAVDLSAMTEEHILRITASPDPMLTGARMSIDSVEHGGRRFSRFLYATLYDA